MFIQNMKTGRITYLDGDEPKADPIEKAREEGIKEARRELGILQEGGQAIPAGSLKMDPIDRILAGIPSSGPLPRPLPGHEGRSTAGQSLVENARQRAEAFEAQKVAHQRLSGGADQPAGDTGAGSLIDAARKRSLQYAQEKGLDLSEATRP